MACTPPSGSATPSSATTSSVPLASRDRKLVVITLSGGNDALNTVAPVVEDRYQSMRGTLALDPAAALDIGDGFALHPSLTRCSQLWADDRLAVVHGVGFDALDRSHFHCMDVWQAGSEGDQSTGWLGRWLDADGTDPLDAVVIGRGNPLLTRGAQRSAAVVPTGPFELPGDRDLHDLLARINAPARGRSPLENLAARSTQELLDVVSTLSPLLAGSQAIDTFATRLDTVATLLKAGLPTRAFAVELGGFDTQARQPPTHAGLLTELDAALGAFLDRVGDQRVTVVIYSEFGRRVAPNASDGTDHGGAGTVLLAGSVRGGHHGEPPPLGAPVDGDLATSTDFRSVFGAALEGVLGIPSRDVLGAGPAPLDLV